jgi:hypothetical protein
MAAMAVAGLVCLTCSSLDGTRDALWGNGMRGFIAVSGSGRIRD